MQQLYALPLLLLLLALGLAQAAASARPLDDESQLRRTLAAVELAIDYMDRHQEQVNLDGVIGVRTVEGQFGSLLARYWPQLPAWAVTQMRRIQSKAARTGRTSTAAVRRTTPIYFQIAGRLISEHYWSLFYPTRALPPVTAVHPNPKQFSEQFSDYCIHEFYGLTKCKISGKCWSVLAESEGLTDYSLTHQVFYLLNGFQANCMENMTVMAGNQSVIRILDRLCARVFAEASNLEKNAFPLEDRDLFMEQIGLCGLAGYTEMAQWRWWHRIIHWQRPNGCYGRFENEKFNMQNFNPSSYGKYRRKRAEASLSTDGCLSHRTSVALDALVAFVRRSIEQLLKLQRN